MTRILNSTIRGHGWQGSGMVFATLLLVAYSLIGLTIEPAFLSKTNLISILFTTAVLLPITLGMQALLLLGRFDLSLGAQASLYGMLAGITFSYTNSIEITIFVPVCFSIIIGFTNGYMISKLNLDQLVVTLAMMGIIRSISLLVNDGRIITSIPLELGISRIQFLFGIPLIIYLALFFIIASDYTFKNSPIFRRLYIIGGNADAAERAGIRVDRITILTFCAAALAAAVVGMLQAGRTHSASPLVFQDLAIDAIAACLVGGSAMLGGRGSMTGAAIGLLTVVATRNLVVITGVSVYWREFAVGLLLITAVAIQRGATNRLRDLISILIGKVKKRHE